MPGNPTPGDPASDDPMQQAVDGSAKRPTMVKAIYASAAVNGLCALLFGGLMMLFPLNTPLGLDGLLPAMENFPLQMFFETLFFPGLALFLCNGVCNLIAAGLFFRSQDGIALRFALAAGILLVIWDVYELIFLPNPLAVVYGLVGIAQTVLSILSLRKA